MSVPRRRGIVSGGFRQQAAIQWVGVGATAIAGGIWGALLARIGEGESFPVGEGSEFTADARGPLLFGINDLVLEDNSGEFVVIIELFE